MCVCVWNNRFPKVCIALSYIQLRYHHLYVSFPLYTWYDTSYILHLSGLYLDMVQLNHAFGHNFGHSSFWTQRKIYLHRSIAHQSVVHRSVASFAWVCYRGEQFTWKNVISYLIAFHNCKYLNVFLWWYIKYFHKIK